MLLEPIDADARQALMDQCEWAHQQRNTVAHGVDRELVGFDGSPTTFDQLVWKVDAWGRETAFRLLRLLNEIGNLEEVLTCLDAGTTDTACRTRIANALRV